VLRYLARYVHRVAITNSRIVAFDERFVTIRYKERKSSRWRTCRLSGHEFMRRFLQHVLPKGLHKVRYFGLWHPSKRAKAAQARLLLQLEQKQPSPPLAQPAEPAGQKEPGQNKTMPQLRPCPHCHNGHLHCVGRLTPKNALGP
jgi:Putative transposase